MFPSSGWGFVMSLTEANRSGGIYRYAEARVREAMGKAAGDGGKMPKCLGIAIYCDPLFISYVQAYDMTPRGVGSMAYVTLAYPDFRVKFFPFLMLAKTGLAFGVLPGIEHWNGVAERAMAANHSDA